MTRKWLIPVTVSPAGPRDEPFRLALSLPRLHSRQAAIPSNRQGRHRAVRELLARHPLAFRIASHPAREGTAIVGEGGSALRLRPSEFLKRARVPRLVETHLAGARDLEAREPAERLLADCLRELDALLSQRPDRRVDVMAHQEELVLTD